jgi:two-component system sensor histidine kinase MprB
VVTGCAEPARIADPARTWQVRIAGGLATVGDDGPGVRPDQLPRIFERFYRAGGPVTRPGSGLGLAIAAEIAVAHGGAAQAAPAAPHGLRVRLALPSLGRPGPHPVHELAGAVT